MSKEIPIPKPAEELTPEEILAAVRESEKSGDHPAATETETETPEPKAEEVVEAPAETAEEVYTAADGTVYKAKTKEELWEKVTGALNSTKMALKDREHKLYELKPKEEPKPEQFNLEKYQALWIEDPIAADRYKASFDDEIKQQRAYLAETREREVRAAAVQTFYREVPDYAKVDTPEVSAAFRTRMEERKRPVTADNLKLTYFELRAEGKIPDVPEVTERPKAPPPTPSGTQRRGTGSPRLITVAEAEGMTKEEIRAYMEKHKKELAGVQ